MSAQGSLRSLAGRSVIRGGKATLKTPMETLQTLLGWHPSPLKHISDQEHDLGEEYRIDDERHVALQSPTDHYRYTPPR
ncbi:hypothetical protein TNCV_1373251 [Trichonephila clavipes]|uniref:Uncharacterized protein n=1 Tax=Trichonephila clavipes TaxID=2585209 RepID=A0A8X6WHW6_TRICX|nr:hypothetical protein TNCV_1373251 [Trichonephila clavipes]